MTSEATISRPGPRHAPGDVRHEEPGHAAIAQLAPLLRKVVGSRLHDSQGVEDVVQETLLRLMSAGTRLEPDALMPYAIVTARNVIAGHWRRTDTSRRNEHRLIDVRPPSPPEDEVLQREDADALARALDELTSRERDAIVAHEVDGVDTTALAEEWGTSRGAVAAQLNRTRAKLRVEFLLAADGQGPPTPRCRPVLYALSSGDRRRQVETDAGHHLLECEYCAVVSGPLLERRARTTPNEVRVVVDGDRDIVAARQRGRELAARAAFSPTQLTMIATAISELARNIVRFAKRGEIVVSLIGDDEAVGVRIVANDVGPGIADIEQALEDGYTTYNGLGLGLGGCRRLMDEFAISSEVGRGTTVAMSKWCTK